MFKRKLYTKMVAWKQESMGRTALLIEGARRVGKSTLVESFAKNEYESSIIIDFSTASGLVKSLFEDLSDLNYLFLQLQLQYHTTLVKRESLIVFDEVQLWPLARQAIKTLVKDGRFDYVETGSLISINRNVKDILIPSEERCLRLYPMDYEEFRWALGDDATIPLLKNAYDTKLSLGEVMNRKLLRDFKIYMLVGGMPQAVNTYLEQNNFQLVDEVKRSIISLYEQDFRKIDPSGKMSLLFDSIPSQLYCNSPSFQLTKVLPDERMDNSSLLMDLVDSMTVLVCYQSNDPNAGMSTTKNLRQYKLFVADTGLFVTLAFKDKDFTENDLYAKLLNDKLSANLGFLYENVVAQMLAAGGNELFYHTWYDEKSHHSYEVDFLIARKAKICPLEVKSSGYNRHVSLDLFVHKYSARIQNQYLVYTKDYRHEQNLVFLPVYMTPFL